jgi:hypothetical protein
MALAGWKTGAWKTDAWAPGSWRETLTGTCDPAAIAAAVWRVQVAPGVTALTALRELWRLAGLDGANPLTVTQTARTAGAISQAIAEAAGAVTVTRQ